MKEISIDTVKGLTIGYEGETFTMTDSMRNIGWASPTEIDSDKKAALKKALEEDKSFVPDISKDPYWYGLGLGKAARLALIAD